MLTFFILSEAFFVNYTVIIYRKMFRNLFQDSVSDCNKIYKNLAIIWNNGIKSIPRMHKVSFWYAD